MKDDKQSSVQDNASDFHALPENWKLAEKGQEKGGGDVSLYSTTKPDTNCSACGDDRKHSKQTMEAAKSSIDEAITFPTTCPSCQNITNTNVCIKDIPYFKEVVIMALNCEQCGYKSNEIKVGGAVPKLGTKIILTARKEDDLARDVLKSDTAGVEIPELELVLDEGGLGGMYTTVEGILDKIHNQLKYSNPFENGDAATKIHHDNDGGSYSKHSAASKRYLEILDKIEAMKTGHNFPFTLIVTDPLSNSFVGPISHDFIPATFCEEDIKTRRTDQGLDMIYYQRSHEQNELLGLNDMNT